MSDVFSDFPVSERRARLRFPLIQEIRYRSRWKRLDLAGRGETLNISSSGALLTTEHQLDPGTRIELSINWPMQLNESASLKLVVDAAVVRVDEGRAAVRFVSHEFRIVARRRIGAESAA